MYIEKLREIKGYFIGYLGVMRFFATVRIQNEMRKT